MTRSILGLTLVCGFWMLCGCRDDDEEPSRPGTSTPIFPVAVGEAGAGSVDAAAGPDASGSGGAGSDGGAIDGGSAGPQPDQLPCDVASFLSARCGSCHGAQPLPGIPMALASYADLTTRSRLFADQTHAQRALARIQLGTMPPGGGLNPGEVQLFASWVQAGAQPGVCGGGGVDSGVGGAGPTEGGVADAASGIDAAVDAGAPPASSNEAGAGDAAMLHDAAPDAHAASDTGTADPGGSGLCSSDRHWDGGNRGSALMTPGQACLGCHAATAPIFSFAGTVFAGAHEPDDCFGVLGNGVSILIKGANGQRLTITPNSAGNFVAAASVPKPYTVEVLYQGRIRAKTQPQTSGDCNGCHSAQGSNGAAGRITLP